MWRAFYDTRVANYNEMETSGATDKYTKCSNRDGDGGLGDIL
jgi:hypothetical protein